MRERAYTRVLKVVSCRACGRPQAWVPRAAGAAPPAPDGLAAAHAAARPAPAAARAPSPAARPAASPDAPPAARRGLAQGADRRDARACWAARRAQALLWRARRVAVPAADHHAAWTHWAWCVSAQARHVVARGRGRC